MRTNLKETWRVTKAPQIAENDKRPWRTASKNWTFEAAEKGIVCPRNLVSENGGILWESQARSLKSAIQHLSKWILIGVFLQPLIWVVFIMKSIIELKCVKEFIRYLNVIVLQTEA